jgi:hypothetical protein
MWLDYKKEQSPPVRSRKGLYSYVPSNYTVNTTGAKSVVIETWDYEKVCVIIMLVVL